jgi:hypothetical protein
LSAYDAGAWHDFFVTAGTAAAALTGLLFVALSIQLDRVLGHPEHRFRARGNFFGLTVVMVMALVVLMPSLNGRWLGVGILMGVIGGISVMVGEGGGLAWPAIESIGMLLIALLGAWSLLVGVAQRSSTAAAEQRSAGG